VSNLAQQIACKTLPYDSADLGLLTHHRKGGSRVSSEARQTISLVGGIHLLRRLAAEHDQPRFAVRSAGNSLSARLPAVISQLRMATIAGASLVACGT
jgi:hypothetical protein